MIKQGVIILSGGLDSSVLAHFLIKEKKTNLLALSFDYGQKHRKELDCAAFQAKSLKIPHKIINLGFMNEAFTSSLLSSGDAIPEGHYEDENMKQTVVPNRNMILISIAAGFAISQNREYLFYGAHAGDHSIYPDCRGEFIQKLRETLSLCDWQNLTLEAPFQNLKKDEIVKIGYDMEIDFSQTWTCYKGGEKSCGVCGSCSERLEAFEKNGFTDPLIYL
ncbi:7-cyano-7-deazaguanine synthase QueC [Candidatus Gracilibacteria bacterium]|nr:7-cyano-7-deazaguanine synthase QueC [Candidatus Gracilibacteria bacterium]